MIARAAIASLVSLATLSLFAATLASAPVQGGLFLNWQSAGPCAFRASGDPEQLQASGLRAGDVIRLDRLSLEARVRMFYPPVAGSKMTIPVERNGTEQPVTIAISGNGEQPALGTLIRFIFLALGLFALWRGRDAASLGLGVFVCGCSTIFSGTYALLGVPATIVAGFVIQAVIASAMVGLVAMATALTSPYVPAQWIRIAWLVSPIVALGQFVAASFDQVIPLITGCKGPWALPMTLILFGLQIGIAMTFLGATMQMAPAAERGRFRWIYWSTLIGFAGPFVGILISIFGLPRPTFDWYNLSVLAIPFGFTYAVLRHRLIDIGFVLNRAIVYGTLTTVIVGILAVAEGLLAKAALGRSASLTLELGVALGLGLSFNALHKRIDTLVDRVFFRQKHQAEEALNRLAHESAYVEKPAVLLDRAIADLSAHSGAASAAIYERDGDGYRLTRARDNGTPPEVVDADDPAFVRMRADLRDVELEDVASTLGRSGLAVPMTVRGSLLGAVVLGPRSSGEPYAPDERALLRLVAREIAGALHAMQAKDHADFVGALATGLIDAQAAQARAKQLRALG